jgi:3-oxoacyl-[acyl-carrier-protein] synthase I
MSQVFVTATGGISAQGGTVSEMWEKLLAGKSGIGPLSIYDQDIVGGQIENYNPKQLLSNRKLLKLISRHDVLGMNAADQAICESGLLEYRESLSDKEAFNYKTALFVGSTGSQYSQNYDYLPAMARSREGGEPFGSVMNEVVHPMWLLRVLPNNVIAYVSIEYGINGENHNICNHSISGFQAILEAYHALKSGRADRAIVVAYDVQTELHNWIYYHKMGLLSPSAIRSFDHQHDGTVLAEGAGALVLETQESMEQRGATAYAEILGGSVAGESSGVTKLDENGEGLYKTMAKAFSTSQVSPESLGLIVSHGNGTVQSDLSEAKALSRIFTNQSPPITGFKWGLGHTFAASGTLETALMLRALKENKAPGIATWEKPARGCEKLSISNETKKLTSPLGMILGRGFFGQNTALLVQAL